MVSLEDMALRSHESRSPLKTAESTKVLPYTVKILKFGTPQTIAIIVLKIEKFDVTLH